MSEDLSKKLESESEGFGDAVSWLMDSKKIPVTRLNCRLLQNKGVELWVARLDQVDPLISGNKWFKLKYNLVEALDQRASHIVSFGGAYSNHLHALAAACYRLGLKSTAVLRGELVSPLNPTLSDCESWGMSFLPVTRAEYREKTSPSFIQRLHEQLGMFYMVPEGGSNALAVKGTAEIVSRAIISDFGIDHIVLPCGTGGTLAGVAASQPDISVVGIPVLKGAEFLNDDIESLLKSAGCSDLNNWVLECGGHFGGYGKTTPELLAFIAMMASDYGIPLDQVYTGKMLLRVIELIDADFFVKGSQLLVLHTGGLQGLRSL